MANGTDSLDRVVQEVGHHILVSDASYQFCKPVPRAFQLSVAVINREVVLRVLVQGHPDPDFYNLQREEAVKFAEAIINAAKTLSTVDL